MFDLMKREERTFIGEERSDLLFVFDVGLMCFSSQLQ